MKTKTRRSKARKTLSKARSTRRSAKARRPLKGAKTRRASATVVAAADEGVVSFHLDVKKEGLEPILGAAYLMMDRAYVLLEGDKAKTLVVRLKPKTGADLAALEEVFLRELQSQKVRWAIAKNNLPVREYVAEQAVLLANGKLPPAPSSAPAPAEAPFDDQLSEAQRKEIETLISEVEAEIKAMNDKKTSQDPKNIRASWEEKHEAKKA